MIGGTAVGIIPTKSSYFGKCYYFYQLAGGTGDHRISFDPTSLRRRFLECILLQPQKLLFFFALGTTCKLRGARDEYVSSNLIMHYILLSCCYTVVKSYTVAGQDFLRGHYTLTLSKFWPNREFHFLDGDRGRCGL